MARAWRENGAGDETFDGEEEAMTALYECTMHTDGALGPVRLVATDDALVAVWFGDVLGRHDEEARPLDAGARHDVFTAAARELGEYLRGRRKTFDVPIAMRGTAFDREVWSALCTIPFGTTWSYGELARAVGRPAAARAVGAANGRNPLGIVVPCHRVIGKNGALTGYAGGLPRKTWLLAHEGALPRALPLAAPAP